LIPCLRCGDLLASPLHGLALCAKCLESAPGNRLEDWPPFGLLLYRFAPGLVFMVVGFVAGVSLDPLRDDLAARFLFGVIAGLLSFLLGLSVSSRHLYLARRAAAKRELARLVAIHETSRFATVLYRSHFVQVRFWKHGGLLVESDEAFAIIGTAGERILVPYSEVELVRRYFVDMTWTPLASLRVRLRDGRQLWLAFVEAPTIAANRRLVHELHERVKRKT
jgi:hypothetical protein